MTEIWRPIVGYEGFYEVSNFGNVRSLDRYVNTKNNHTRLHRGKILEQNIYNEYKFVHVSKLGQPEKLLVHRLVAEVFLPNPNNYPVVNHKDENPSNNNVENLEWCTYGYNNQYNELNKRRFKTRTERIDSKEIKLGHEIILLNKDLNVIKTYINAEWAKKEDGYDQSALRACVNRKKIIKYKEMFCLLKDEYDFIVLSVKKEYINDFLNSYLVKGNILIKNKEEREKHILNFIDSYYYK